jgi:hemin uptake protein HemP
LLNIAFAPGRDGNHPAQYAEQAGKGYRFTVTNLESGTKYGYNIEVKDASNKTIKSHTGAFTTQSTTAVDNIPSPISNSQKLLRNGQLYIYHNGSTYNAMGMEL